MAKKLDNGVSCTEFPSLLKVPDALKDNVPDHIKEKGREMARQELQRRLEELNMSMGEAKGYGELLTATQVHMVSLHNLLERQYIPYLI